MDTCITFPHLSLIFLVQKKYTLLNKMPSGSKLPPSGDWNYKVSVQNIKIDLFIKSSYHDTIQPCLYVWRDV